MNLIEQFSLAMKNNAANVTQIQNIEESLSLIATFIAENNINSEMRISPSLAQEWPNSESIHITSGTTNGTDKLCASRAWAGIADTGTLVLLSGPDNPTRLNFLADFHLVFLHANQIVANKAAAWQQLEKMPSMPRAVNFISGPSRTADIEQTIQLGAHGPRYLWIFVQV